MFNLEMVVVISLISLLHYYPPPWRQSVTLLCALRSPFGSLCATEDNSVRHKRLCTPKPLNIPK